MKTFGHTVMALIVEAQATVEARVTSSSVTQFSHSALLTALSSVRNKLTGR